MARLKKASKRLNSILRFVIKNWLTWRFDFKILGGDVTKLKPPYLLLANHTNFWDPLFVASFIPEPVYFVTSDEYFRNPLLKVVLGLVGAIPKTKFVSDFDTVKSILKVKQAGGVIGIFPEGKRNWDGVTEPIVHSTAKLIKSLKIPVVGALMKGAYLSKPRWAKKSRRGPITVCYQIILTPEEIKTMPVKEIYEQITSGLAYDEYAIQQGEMVPYPGKRLAEKLELYLFTCPQCRQMGTMKSEGDDFFCHSCGYRVFYDQYGLFRPKTELSKKELSFRNPREWNRWQLDLLKERIVSLPEKSLLFLADDVTSLLQGSRLKSLTKLGAGQLQLMTDTVLFINSQAEPMGFKFEKIKGLNVQHNDQLEFYYENSLYRFIFKPNISAYKWLQALRIMCAARKRGGKAKEMYL